MQTPEWLSPKLITSFLIGVLAIGLFAVAGCGLEIVDTGHRGVKTEFGKVIGESLPEGLYFYNPLTSKIVELDVREQRWDENTTAFTKDVQAVKVSFTLNFHPEASQMHVLYEKVGRDWAQKIVPQVIQGKLKEVVGHYEAVKLVSERQGATGQIRELIAADLKAKFVTVKSFEITNLDFNDQFEHAVEAKVVAIQQAEEAKNKTVRVSEEASQKIISAKAEAESMRIRAQALTQNRSLVEYEAVQKWDGKLPEMMMGGATPFINVNGTKKN
jgi:regulator of protease activity HflC (stomatin/prohibitin superfamily)